MKIFPAFAVDDVFTGIRGEGPQRLPQFSGALFRLCRFSYFRGSVEPQPGLLPRLPVLQRLHQVSASTGGRRLGRPDSGSDRLGGAMVGPGGPKPVRNRAVGARRLLCVNAVLIKAFVGRGEIIERTLSPSFIFN